VSVEIIKHDIEKQHQKMGKYSLIRH